MALDKLLNLRESSIARHGAMDYTIILFWFITLSTAAGLVAAFIRVRGVGYGWIFLHLLILALAILGRSRRMDALIYTASGVWTLFLLLPGLLSKWYYQSFLQQNFRAARRLARLIAILHPSEIWRRQTPIIEALQLAQEGELEAASTILAPLRNDPTPAGLSAAIHFFRIHNEWESLLLWEALHKEVLSAHPQFLHVRMRARGETGDIQGMVAFYSEYRKVIARLIPPASRDLCFLMLFVFCGKRAQVESLFRNSLSILPLAVQKYWLATGDLHAGEVERSKNQFEAILPEADSSLQTAIERRLQLHASITQPLDGPSKAVLNAAMTDQRQEETFGAQPSILEKCSLATLLLIVINLIMFAVEMSLGGTTNWDVLFRLGALFSPAIEQGEWWRLFTSLFLHFGIVHLLMNMFALWLLGPFVEFALGHRNYLFVYLFSGVGSMATVFYFSADVQTTVGASGAVMAVVGATGALMLRGWVREKARAARKRFHLILLIVLLQSVFDFVVPQISMTAHLSGILLGFALTLSLPDRLSCITERDPVPAVGQCK